MSDKRISLMFCIEKRKNEKAKELVAEVGVNTEIKEHGTPVLLACLFNNLEMVRYFLSLGAKVNVKNSDGDTPLILACENGNFEMVRELIKNGAEVNVKNKYQMTPIIEVISEHPEKLEIIELLLKKDADPFIEIRGYENHPGRIADNAYELAKYMNKGDILKLIDQYWTNGKKK